MSGLCCEMSTNGEARQIVGIGREVGFVKIVDAPYEPALDVAPGAEVFHMKIADGEHLRTLCQFSTNLGPDLRPAIVRGAEKRKYRRLHIAVLETEILLHQDGVMAQPIFELAGCFNNVHIGRTIAGRDGESQRSLAWQPSSDSD